MIVTMKTILDAAAEGGYAVLAPEIAGELDGRGCIRAAEELAAPLILSIPRPLTKNMRFTGSVLTRLAREASVPVAVHLDHGAGLRDIVEAIQSGFTSVMIDASALPFEENIKATSRIAEIAHAAGVSVEAELGHVGQGSDGESASAQNLTEPQEARDFILRTGVDALAVAIGTAHGVYKGGAPRIDFERLTEIKSAVEGFPLVLHGSSGSGEENIRRACRLGINKVNVCTELMQAARDAVQTGDFSGRKIYELYDCIQNAIYEAVKKQILMIEGQGKA